MLNPSTLPHLLKKQILEHALASPEVEVCGLIGGDDNTALTIYPVTNIATDQARRFLMDPEEQINTMRNMRENNETLWGIYHSHPNTPAEPSVADLEMAAYPDVIYVIVSLVNDSHEIKCFIYDGVKMSNAIDHIVT
jgi:proteasome lid subunit RPN8/RPN11